MVEMVALAEEAEGEALVDQALQVKVMTVRTQTVVTLVAAAVALAKLAEQMLAAMAEMALKIILPALMFTMQEAVAVERKPQDLRHPAASPGEVAVVVKAETQIAPMQKTALLTLEAAVEVVVGIPTEAGVLEDLEL
jgi:hypothetical protein